MSDRVILDLGEYGEILVEPAEAALSEPSGELAQAGLGDAVQKAGQKVKVKAQELLKLPLTGLGKLFLAAAPDPSDNDQWQLDQYNVEFEVGIELETGANAGAVVIVKPNSGFKCVYTWKRRPETE